MLPSAIRIKAFLLGIGVGIGIGVELKVLGSDIAGQVRFGDRSPGRPTPSETQSNSSMIQVEIEIEIEIGIRSCSTRHGSLTRLST